MEQNSEQDKQRKKRPGKQGLHGEIYQLKLLMLFLKRGVDNGYSFQLSTEKKEARKFDDLFFEITKDGKKEYRLLQAKHKEDESKKITFDSLLTESDGDYSLVKYFFSYQDSKKDKLFQNGIIKDVTVCTNIDLDLSDKYELKTIKEIIIKVEDCDSILDTNSENSHKNVRYRFHHDIILLLKPKLQDYNLTRLAKRLVDCLLENKSITHHDNNDIFKSYYAVLANEIIDTKNKNFFDGFVNESNTLSEEAKRFRQILKEEITRQSQGKLHLEKVNVAIVASKLNFNLSDKFGLVKDDEEQNWPEDTSELAKHLIENILSAKRIKHNKDPFRRYDIILAKEVIDVEKKKFRDEFISGKGISEDAKKFRNILETESQSQGKLSLEEINGARTIENKRIGLTLSTGFGNGSTNEWPQNAISDDDIKDFLDHLVFAVNQPNEQQLGNIIENDISKEFNFAAKDYVYNEFFVKMLDWLNGKGKEFISYEDGKSFFDKAKQKLSELELTGLTVEYIFKLEKFGIQFNLEAIQEIQLDNFISSQNSNTQIFNVVTEQITLSAIKVYQILQCLSLHQKSYIFMQLDSVLHLKDRVVQAFKGNNNLLIIECKPTNNDFQELYQDLKDIVQNPEKKLILISEENDPLANKFKEDISNKYQKKIDDKKSLIDLTSESQNKILNEEKLKFQGEKISIKQMLFLKRETLVSRATLDKLNLGASELEILLKDSIVEIWNEQPQLSYLESAHYKTYTRIGLDQLKQALVAANPEDKFIFVGNGNNVKKLLPTEQQDTLTHFKDRRSVPLDSHRFILLDANQEEEQFKQMCHQVDKANVEKKAGVKQTVLYLLKEEGNDWIWKQTYTRDFYIERRFYPVVVKKEISKLVTESHSSDFIVFSGINEKELLSLLEVKNEKENFKKNTIGLMNEAAAQKVFNHLRSSSTNHKSIHWLKINEVEGKKQLQWYKSCGELSQILERLDKEAVNYSIDEMSLAEKKEISKLVTESQSSDFIVFSGINEEELLSLFDVENKKDNFKKNTIVLMDEAAAQTEFDHLCSGSTNHKSIHWLKVNDVEGKKQLRWYDSCGEVRRLREKLDKEAVHFSIDEISLADKKERVVVLADEPGMGKSTTLARVAEFIKKLKPFSWVIKIDLNRHQNLFSKSVKTKEEVIDLLFQTDPTLKNNSLAQKILKHQLECPGKVILLCDGFDEVKLEKQGNILTLFEFLTKESAVNIWVTTRVHDQKKLEDHLSVLAYTFKPLDETKQINFLSQFWTTTLKLTGKGQDPLILEGYAKEVIHRFEQSIQAFKGDRTFISIPLRARMLAEVFYEEVKTALAENKAASHFFKADEKFVIGDLYQKFIDQKYDIYLGEKTTIQGLGSDSKSILTEAYTNDYKFLAMKTLFNNDEILPLLGDQKLKLFLNTLSRIGLIQGNMEPINFIHRTFAEYFSAKWLAEHKENMAVKNFIGIQLFKKESSVVRRFFDHFLTESMQSHNTVLRGDISTFKKLLNRNLDMSETDSLGRTVLHMAAQEGRDEFIQLLEVKSNNELISDQFGKSPLHYAACFGHDKVVNQLLRNLIDIDLYDHIFRTPLHYGTEINGNRLFKNSVYKKSKFVRLVNKKDLSGNPSLYYAADNEHWNAACNLLLHGADCHILTTENKKKLLLFAADETHGTYANSYHHLRPVVGLLSIQVPEAVHEFDDIKYYPRLLSYFFANGHTKVIEALLGSIQDSNRRERIINKKDNSFTPLERSIDNYDLNDADHLRFIKYLFNEGVHHGIQIYCESKGKVLLVAATLGNLHTFKYLVKIERVRLDYSDSGHFAASDRALLENKLPILKYLWENYRKSINDYDNLTPLHVAAFYANLQATHYLCTNGADINAKDIHGHTPLHSVAQAPHKLTDYLKVMQYLIEEQGADINLVDEEGKTALDLAIEKEQWTIADYLIKKKAHACDLSLVSNIKTFYESPQDTHALYLAIRNKETKWTRFLLQHQVDVNRSNHEGRTLLHCVTVANWRNKVEIIKLLLQRGSQYDVRDNNNKTALDLILEKKYACKKSIRLLQLIEKLFNSRNLTQELKRKKLSDEYDRSNPMQFILNARSVKNGTLLHVAVNNGDLAALKRLLELNREYLRFKSEHRFDISKYYEAIDISGKDEKGNTPLHCAAQLGEQKSLLLLLEEGAIFNARNSQSRTPNIQAKSEQHQEIVTFLQQIEKLFDAIKQGTKLEIIDEKLQRVSVYVRDCDGKTLLHLAAQKGQIENIKVLLNCIDPLKQRKAINVLDHQHSTPLHDAAANGQADAIRLLLQRGAQFNIKDKQNRTPLDRLPNPDNSLLKSVDQLFNDIQLNLPVAVIEKLRRFDVSQEDLCAILHARDELGTLLHWAARENYSDVLQQLLMNGAIYDAKDSLQFNDLFELIKEWMYDKKPLKFSVEEVTKDQVKLTIVKKARNREGKTPLHTNANYFRLKYLLKQGVDLKVQDQDGNTPLHDAAGRGDIAVVKLFLDNGAEVNAENKIKQTPLHVASSRGHFVQLLWNEKEEPNIQDKNGKTPLQLAKDHFVIVQLLLNEKADSNIQDKNGKTPLQLAEDHFVIVQRLLNEKTDPNIQDENEKTLLLLAEELNEIQEVIDILKSKSILTTKGLIGGEVLFEEGLPGPSH